MSRLPELHNNGDCWPLLCPVCAWEDREVDPTPCCPDPECNGRPCTFPGYAENH